MKINLNFTKPISNGMKDRMIQESLKALINPTTGNLVINHNEKVFEIEQIQEPEV
jgi:hypothetical protein